MSDATKESVQERQFDSAKTFFHLFQKTHQFSMPQHQVSGTGGKLSQMKSTDMRAQSIQPAWKNGLQQSPTGGLALPDRQDSVPRRNLSRAVSIRWDLHYNKPRLHRLQQVKA